MSIDISVIKSKIKKRSPFNIGGIIFLIIAVYLICTILICDDCMPISISSMSSYFNHWVKHWHFLAVGLLPIYVSLMIFGAALFGICLGSVLHYWVAGIIKKAKKNDQSISKVS